MKNSRKLIWIVVFFFLLHFVLQFGVAFLGLAATMHCFDNPDDCNTVMNNIYELAFNVLSFPIVFFSVKMPAFFSGILGYTPFILNSALWSLVFYFLVRKLFPINLK